MAKAPAVIGRYQVLERIGQGGMGSLYLAFDPMLERQIAIKLLRDDNEELRERFAREARSVARLRHRNIVTIFDVGEQDGQPFIAMEYIQGQTLADLIRDGAAIPMAQKLGLIGELCDGLAFAHTTGIVHRDIKPPNVMVERDGTVKVLDFGIARIAESGMTQAGMLIGTLNYMSPEQVAGRTVDLRSDIFAVGAVLYELISCTQAYPGGLHNGILNRILHEAPVPIHELVPGIDAEIVAIIEQALAKDPDARYENLPAMRRDLQRVQQRLAQQPQSVETQISKGPDETQALPTIAARGRSAQTPRRSTDREGLARRRATQIAAHLEEGQLAFTTGDLERAIAAAEQVLLLDPETQDALDLLDRARAALDDRHARQMLERGETLLASGALTEARGVADQALTLVPGASYALRFREAVERAQAERERERQRIEAEQERERHRIEAERERERQRAEAIRQAIQRAHALLAEGAFLDAESAAAEALALDPDQPEAQSITASAIARRRQQEQDALDRRAAEAVAHAERLFSSGQHDQALQSLRSFDTAQAGVTSAIDRLTNEKARIERERREAEARLERERREADARARRLAAAIAEAERTPSHEAAVPLLEAADAADPGDANLARVLAERRAARDADRRRADERRQKVDAAVARAAAATTDEEGIEHLEQALTIEPEDARVKGLLADRQHALARRRAIERQARERDAASDAAIAAAKHAPSHEAAVAMLAEAAKLNPAHHALQKQLASRQALLEQERLEIRRARERTEKASALLATAERTASHDAAIATLEQALTIDPENGAVAAALARRRTARDDEIRRERDRRARVTATLERVAAAKSHDDAVEILQQALRLDEGDPSLARELDVRRRALEEARRAAQLAAEREERIATVLREAAAVTSHEKAIAMLTAAAKRDPGGAIESVLADRQVALGREREEIQKEKARREAVAAAVKRAKNTASHDAALAIIAEALTLDPKDPAALALRETRTAALARERAEATRLEAIELARTTIVSLIDGGRLDEADAELERADAALQPGKAFKEVRRQLERARAVALRAATGSAEPSSGVASPFTRPPVLAAASALAIAVVAGAFMLLGGGSRGAVSPSSQSAPPAQSSTTSAPQPVPSPTTTPSAAPVSPPSAPSPVESGASATPPETAAGGASAAPDSVTLPPTFTNELAASRKQLRAGDLRGALATLTPALKQAPTDPSVARVLSDIIARSRQEAISARNAASRHGDAASGLQAYKDANSKMNEATQRERSGRASEAAIALWDAAGLFRKADADAGEAIARLAAAAEASRRAAANTTSSAPPPAPTARGNTTPPAATGANTSEVPSAKPPATPPPTAQPERQPASPAPPTAAAVDEEAAIRATLRAYGDAYSKLDVAAVQSVFPSVNADAIRRGFSQLSSQTVRIEQAKITVAGATATAECTVLQQFRPRVGSGDSRTVQSTFRLQKSGGRWIIVERR